MLNLLEQFIWEKQGVLAPRTLDHYQYLIHECITWLGLNDPHEIRTDDLRRWIQSRPWSGSAQHVGIAALRTFFRWAMGKDSPAEQLAFPKRYPNPQRTLTVAQVEELLGSLDTARPKGVRDVALICMLLDTGLRATEVCTLLLKNVDLEARSLVVRIKGGQLGYAVYGLYTQAAVNNWLAVRSQLAKADTLFVSVGGNRPGTSMTRYGLNVTLRNLGKSSGIGPLSPHDFRRTFATLSLKGGAPSRLVQLAGRWSNIKEVERYSQALSAADFEPYSPMSRIMGV